MANIPGITFRRIPDEAGDSCTFLNWFLPTEDIAREVVEDLKANGILAGNFYWFNNNWHYIRKWQHLKSAASLNALSDAQKVALEQLAHNEFAESDRIMGRCISTLINLSWTEDQLHDKAHKLAAVVTRVLESKLEIA